MTDYDRLDAIAAQTAQGDDDAVGVLSTGERLYVALAANRCDLLGNDSIAYAISRMEDEDLRELVERHRYDTPARKGNQVDDLAALVRQLVYSLKKAKPDSDLVKRAMDYLVRQELQGSPLRGEEG
jgi:hypothetical protein